MAITFLDERKRQTYLIFILPIIVVAIFLILMFNYFSNAELTPQTSLVKPSKVQIDWEILKDSRLQNLLNFEEISAITEKIGRDNPFSSYK